MSDQKKNRAFHIHSKMSRHEMPKQLKKKFNIEKNTKSQNGKMSDQKKKGQNRQNYDLEKLEKNRLKMELLFIRFTLF